MVVQFFFHCLILSYLEDMYIVCKATKQISVLTPGILQIQSQCYVYLIITNYCSKLLRLRDYFSRLVKLLFVCVICLFVSFFLFFPFFFHSAYISDFSWYQFLFTFHKHSCQQYPTCSRTYI